MNQDIIKFIKDNTTQLKKIIEIDELKIIENIKNNEEDIINLKDIKNRENILSELNYLRNNLNDLMIFLNLKIDNLKKIHQTQLNKAETLISKIRNEPPKYIILKKNNNNNISQKDEIAAREGANNKNQLINYNDKNAFLGSQTFNQNMVINKTIPIKRINIIGKLNIEAKCTDLKDVQSDGSLYYIESINHFAFKIRIGAQDILFHGNIGTIYQQNSNIYPEKIKNCKYGNQCIKNNNCHFYHNPLIYENSHDVRNFVANSWQYTFNKYDTSLNNKLRRFGDKNTLESDINLLNDEEIERFIDQSIHDLLCCIILRNKKKI